MVVMMIILAGGCGGGGGGGGGAASVLRVLKEGIFDLSVAVCWETRLTLEVKQHERRQSLDGRSPLSCLILLLVGGRVSPHP